MKQSAKENQDLDEEMAKSAAEPGTMERERLVLAWLVDQHSNPAHVAYLAGIHPGYFYRVLSGERILTHALVAKAVAAMEVPLAIYRSLTLDEDGISPNDVAQYLATCSDDPALERHPFLFFVDDAFDPWLGARPTPSDPTRRKALFDLDAKRHVAPQATREEFEELLRGWLSDDLGALASGDLALGLAFWAMIRRQQGHRADARDAYILAFRALAARKDSLAEGLLFQWVAVLLYDFDRKPLALRFCSRALWSLVFAGATEWIGPCLFIRGLILHGQKRYAAAAEALEAALAALPAAETTYRYSALEVLAQCHLAQGHAAAALAALGQARPLCPDFPLFRANLEWLEGRILVALQHFAAARETLERVHAFYVGKGEPLDLALLTIDLASLYLGSGQTAALRQLVEEATGRLFLLKKNRQAQKLMNELINRAWAGELTEAYLRKKRQLLVALALPARYRPGRFSRGAPSSRQSRR